MGNGAISANFFLGSGRADGRDGTYGEDAQACARGVYACVGEDEGHAVGVRGRVGLVARGEDEAGQVVERGGAEAVAPGAGRDPIGEGGGRERERGCGDAERDEGGGEHGGEITRREEVRM